MPQYEESIEIQYRTAIKQHDDQTGDEKKEHHNVKYAIALAASVLDVVHNYSTKICVALIWPQK